MIDVGTPRNLWCLDEKSRSIGLGTVGAPLPASAFARLTELTTHLRTILVTGPFATPLRILLRSMQPAREQV